MFFLDPKQLLYDFTRTERGLGFDGFISCAMKVTLIKNVYALMIILTYIFFYTQALFSSISV